MITNLFSPIKHACSVDTLCSCLPTSLNNSAIKVSLFILGLFFISGAVGILVDHFIHLGALGVVACALGGSLCWIFFIVSTLSSRAPNIPLIEENPTVEHFRTIALSGPIRNAATWLNSSEHSRELQLEMLVQEITQRALSISQGNNNHFEITLDTPLLFGKGDFSSYYEPLPQILAEAIGVAIKQTANNLLAQNSVLSSGANVQIGVLFNQTEECLFSGALIAPILPCLHHIPGLKALQLINAGFEECHGKALLAMINNNPLLTDPHFDCAGMSEAAYNAFLDGFGLVLNPRETPPPHPQKSRASPYRSPTKGASKKN